MKNIISISDKWIVYGAGHIGRCIANYLVAQGFEVNLFIDNYITNELTYNNIKIVKKEQVDKELLKSSIVIISINDYFSHDDLALELWEIGARRLLYKTNIICYEKYFSNNQLYDDILAGININGRELSIDAPRKIELSEGIKFLGDNMVLFYLNVENLFVKTTYHQEPINFKCFNPMTNLYSSLIHGTVPDIFEFKVHYQRTKIDPDQPIDEKEFDRVLAARIRIFESMRLAMEFDYDFFIRHPIEVNECEEREGFVVVDGLNRASFLAALGIRNFPCKTSKNHFCKIRKQTHILEDIRWNGQKQPQL